MTHRSSRRRSLSRSVLGGLLTAGLTTVVLAVPVVSGDGAASAPVLPGQQSAPALSAASFSSASFSAARVTSRAAVKDGRRAGAKREGRSKTEVKAAAAPPLRESLVILGQDGLLPAQTPGEAPVEAAPAPSPSGAAASAPRSPAPAGDLGACAGAARKAAAGPVPAAGTVLGSEWKVSAPAPDATFDLTGVVSTAFPSTKHPFVTGVRTPGVRTCIVGGELRGTVDPARSWEWFHDEANAACVKVVAIEWLQIHNTRCHGIEDGFRPQEGEANSNRTEFLIQGTYLSDVADDCLENDYTLGGVLRDNLWESCFTGISERPSSNNGSWTSPADETLTLDRMLIGLRSMPHDSDKGVGPNALFKWSSSANKLVIRCSTFLVPERSVNGTDTMAVPAGTVVDDSACPDNPSTIVWLGGGAYPADTAGIRVVSDRAVWTNAVQAWKAAHGY